MPTVMALVSRIRIAWWTRCMSCITGDVEDQGHEPRRMASKEDSVERFVWVSGAVGHGSNLRPFRNDVGERDHSRLVAIQQLIERGEALDRSDFPQEIF